MSDSDLLLTGPKVPLLNPDLLNIQLTIPQPLREPLAANRHLLPKFGKAVMDAVKASFTHPDTAMRGDITSMEVKRRVELCYEALRILYWEEKVSLLQAFDILTGTLIDTLRMDYGIGDTTDGRGQTDQARRWGVAGCEEVCEAPAESNLNAESPEEIGDA